MLFVYGWSLPVVAFLYCVWILFCMAPDYCWVWCVNLHSFLLLSAQIADEHVVSPWLCSFHNASSIFGNGCRVWEHNSKMWSMRILGANDSQPGVAKTCLRTLYTKHTVIICASSLCQAFLVTASMYEKWNRLHPLNKIAGFSAERVVAQFLPWQMDRSHHLPLLLGTCVVKKQAMGYVSSALWTGRWMMFLYKSFSYYRVVAFPLDSVQPCHVTPSRGPKEAHLIILYNHSRRSHCHVHVLSLCAYTFISWTPLHCPFLNMKLEGTQNSVHRASNAQLNSWPSWLQLGWRAQLLWCLSLCSGRLVNRSTSSFVGKVSDAMRNMQWHHRAHRSHIRCIFAKGGRVWSSGGRVWYLGTIKMWSEKDQLLMGKFLCESRGGTLYHWFFSPLEEKCSDKQAFPAVLQASLHWVWWWRIASTYSDCWPKLFPTV